MTEVPEHLLQRSRDRRRAMGLAVDDDGGAAPAAAPTVSANAPATTAAAAAVKAPVPFPANEPPAPPPPDSEWVKAANERAKVPYWVMPVLLFLPVWLIMYVGTLEAPERQEGVIYEGSVVYEEKCASCHDSGAGPAFNEGITEIFTTPEAQIAWVTQGTQNFVDDGRSTYGDTAKPLGGYNGGNMPAFGEDLTAEELIAVVFYERIGLGGASDELELAELMWDKLDHGELDGEAHFVEGEGGDYEGDGEIADYFAETRAFLAESEEVAAE